jgi:hypothetical protein
MPHRRRPESGRRTGSAICRSAGDGRLPTPALGSPSVSGRPCGCESPGVGPGTGPATQPRPAREPRQPWPRRPTTRSLPGHRGSVRPRDLASARSERGRRPPRPIPAWPSVAAGPACCGLRDSHSVAGPERTRRPALGGRPAGTCPPRARSPHFRQGSNPTSGSASVLSVFGGRPPTTGFGVRSDPAAGAGAAARGAWPTAWPGRTPARSRGCRAGGPSPPAAKSGREPPPRGRRPDVATGRTGGGIRRPTGGCRKDATGVSTSLAPHFRDVLRGRRQAGSSKPSTTSTNMPPTSSCGAGNSPALFCFSLSHRRAGRALKGKRAAHLQ